MDKSKAQDWKGHKPATTAELLNVMTTAITGSARLSTADRVLFTVCEFWASVRNGTLATQLADDAASQLRAAEIAFTTIGLVNAAAIVHCARRGMTESNLSAPSSRIIETMELALAGSGEQIDQVIADFAAQQARNRALGAD